MSDNNQTLRLLEALLFASASPLEETQLARKCPEGTDVPALLHRLQEVYANRGVNLIHVGRGWAFRTAPDLKAALATEATVTRRLSRAAVETLAIIAYHQPITRAEIEDVRGVGLSKGTLDVLFEEGWIEPKGRRHTPGRPLTWGTTQSFLDHFGLESIADLPGIEDLKAAGLLSAMPPVLGPAAGWGEATEGGESAELPLDDLSLERTVHEAGYAADEEDDEDAAALSEEASDDVRAPGEEEPAKAASEPAADWPETTLQPLQPNR